MSPFALLLLLSFAPAAQDSSHLASGLSVKGIRHSQSATAASNGATCYAIRSYIFERQDGNAPVLVGETTCTPSSQAGPQRAKKIPRPRFVPLSLDSGAQEP